MTYTKTAEDDYFKRQEAERQSEETWRHDQEARQAELTQQQRVSAEQQQRCPKCRTLLAMTMLRGVEVARCNSCDGVWLEQDQLERLIHPAGLLSRLARAFRPLPPPP
jgi:uncharacterized protein